MATTTFLRKAPLVFAAARTCRLRLHSMLLAFGRLICLRRRSSVSLSGALGFLGLVAGLLDFLNGFLGWLARRSLFVSLFRPPSAYSLSRLRKVNALNTSF